MKSRDGHVIIAPISQKNFEQMADAMQRPVLKTDTPFATNSGRVRHWNELMAVIEQWTGHRTGVEIESIMDGAAFPAPAFSPSRTP